MISEDTPRNQRRRLLRYLKRGGAVTREDYGPAVGTQWRAASRAGGLSYDPTICAALVRGGVSDSGRAIRVRADHANGPNVRPGEAGQRAGDLI